MGTTEADFDAFYTANWRPLLVQTLGVCGDLATARHALHHAFTDLWQHWPHARGENPKDFVRARAWQLSHWRTQGRVRATKEISSGQREVLKALQKVPLNQRKALVLAGLTDLPMATIGRIVGEPVDRLESLFGQGLDRLGKDLDIDREEAAARLEGLSSLTKDAGLPAPPDLRRRARLRNVRRIAGGAVAAVGLTLASGYLVYAEPTPAPIKAPNLGSAVTDAMLLTPTSMASLGDPAKWTIRSTTDNTEGDGLNSPCQKERFADPSGSKALVRRLTFSGTPKRKAVQTIEVSHSGLKAKAAYATVVGWFAGCREARMQLLSSHQVTGLGDEGLVLQFRAEGEKSTSNFAVSIARVGPITTWTSVVSSGSLGAGPKALTATLDAAVYKLCGSRLTTRCDLDPAVEALPPPPSGEALGMLAVADLPAVGDITQPWAGTKAAPERVNPAATSCDNADFIGAGATQSMTRTFLIPEATLADRFGLSETYGTFGSRAAATKFVDTVIASMNGCEDKQLSATLSDDTAQDASDYGSRWYSWRLDSEIKNGVSMRFLMGITQVGRNVAQVNFVPDGKATIDRATFEALVQRARDRLLELPKRSVGSTQTSPSASPSPSSSASP